MENFNPRTREGCDVKLLSTLALARLISIHAPVKGAIRGQRQWRESSRDISIHAPVKGAMGPFALASSGTADFNPRTREGCDLAPGWNSLT